jgi:hypothetical protein
MYSRLGAAVAVLLVALMLGVAPSGASTINLTRGGWCWFADPRAIASGDNVYFGWITGDTGNVEVGRINLTTGGYAQGRLRSHLPADDHSNPTITMDPDGYLVAFYSPHSGKLALPNHMRSHLWYRISQRPGGVTRWGREHTVPTNTFGGLGYTYPTPVWARYRLYVFWRGGDWQPTYSTTTMSFDRWTRAQTLLRGMPHERPYVKYDHYGDAIRFAYTAAHPTRKATDLYFGELRGWAVRRADGTPFRSRHHLPFVYTRGERIYSWRTDGRAWVWDIAHDSDGNPVIVYAVIRNKYNHAYRYARWTGTRWLDHRITYAGPHIDQAPGYSGGVTLDHNDPNVVYLSRMIDGHFEISRWETRDDGRTWMASIAVTSKSEGANMRPFVPLGTTGDLALMWLWGHYEGWKDFSDLHVMLRANLSPPALQRFKAIRAKYP